MPHLSTSLIRRARRQDSRLPLLLRPCRDLPSARNELRWLKEHALKRTGLGTAQRTWQQRLHSLCLERSKGKPLQYILGSQPIGTLDIICKPGVLIPRPETESITAHLAFLLSTAFSPKGNLDPDSHEGQDYKDPLRILDLCTGTGCITLLLHTLLAPTIPYLQIAGVDNSSIAVDLAKANLLHHIANGQLNSNARSQIHFYEGDLLAKGSRGTPWAKGMQWDVVVSNPPYISPTGFDTTTSRSVRRYEPKEALVPPCNSLEGDFTESSNSECGDAFYPHILRLAKSVGTRILLVEVADMAQACRVAGMVLQDLEWQGCQIWRDYPDLSHDLEERVYVNGTPVVVKGEGNGRAVFAWKGFAKVESKWGR